MLRDEVAKWLEAKNNITNVKPVGLSLLGKKWQGAVYTCGGERRYYLIGTRPIHKQTCYKLLDVSFGGIVPMRYDWFIGGYFEEKEDYLSDRITHPFGNHWLLIPWIIKGEPNSIIDEYEDEKYTRMCIDVETF